jgi:hypothetical protein
LGFGTHRLPLLEATDAILAGKARTEPIEDDLEEGVLGVLKGIGKALVGWLKSFFSSPEAAKAGTQKLAQQVIQQDPVFRPLVTEGPYAAPENAKKKPGEPVKADITTSAKNVAAGENKASIVTANLNGKKLFDLLAITAGGKRYLKFVFEPDVEAKLAKRMRKAFLAQVGDAVVLESATEDSSAVRDLGEWTVAQFGCVFVEGYVPGGLDEATKVQTLIFSKDHFDDGEAGQWARDHGFKASDMDETENSFRFRQKNPDGFKVLRTIRFRPGVQAVVGVKESADDSDTEDDLENVNESQRAKSVPPKNRFFKRLIRTKFIETGDRRIYKDRDGDWFYTWDASKDPGEWEVYDSLTLKHDSVLSANGAFLAPKVEGRVLKLKGGGKP